MLVRRAWVSGNVVDAEGNGDGSPISIYNDSIIYGSLFFLQWYFLQWYFVAKEKVTRIITSPERPPGKFPASRIMNPHNTELPQEWIKMYRHPLYYHMARLHAWGFRSRFGVFSEGKKYCFPS